MVTFPISEEDDRVLSRMIIEDRTAGVTSFSQPLFFLNAGQPGCGKTELNNLTRKNVNDDILECNADILRDYHPDAPQILAEYELEYPRITWEAANRWNQSLIQYGKDKKFNLLIETTLKDGALVLGTLKNMKNSGYSTRLQLLAVPRRWSWLGIYTRFESSKADITPARYVSDKDHDDRFDALLENLPAVIESPHIDSIAVYARRFVVAAGAEKALELLTDQKVEVLSTFQKVINRKMDSFESKAFLDHGNRVIHLMRGRSAQEAEIELFQKKLNELHVSNLAQ